MHEEGEKTFICIASDKPKKVSWLGPHVFLIKEVTKFIFSKVTGIGRIAMEVAHGIDTRFQQRKGSICLSAAKEGHQSVLQ